MIILKDSPILKTLPEPAGAILGKSPKIVLAKDALSLVELSMHDSVDGVKFVSYLVSGKGKVLEAEITRAKNGLSVNYPEPYMRRRDPDSMLIGDEGDTDKPRYRDAHGKPFEGLRRETLEWLAEHELLLVPFYAGQHKGFPALAIMPMNAAFFGYGLSLLQGMIPGAELPADFTPRCVVYVAPPFRHSHFAGKQMVVHHRLDAHYEIYSYNLYPGPSAKKGVYGALLHFGEKEGWVTAHCSAVQVVTPYDNRLTLMHEGASGSGKSEMLEHLHREPDGSLLFGVNTVTGEERNIVLPRGCLLRPVVDDMGLCHPSFQKGGGRLAVGDAENGWFIRVNHITKYGTDPDIESLAVHPKDPLWFLNLDAPAGSTALLWEHTEDAPGKPCPNPRVVLPRQSVPEVVNHPVEVDVRSFGVRTPPCTKELPSYGILGIFHILPPALAWLWRLGALRGAGNPSIISKGDLESEGVGTFWPFATGKKVRWANLLLEQLVKSPSVVYALVPNQHVGAWKTGFMPQWIMREFLARRGGAWFRPEQVRAARSPLLGWTPRKIMIEGQTFDAPFLEVHRQAEVGEAAYDRGAEILRDFFLEEVAQYRTPELDPLGKKILDCLAAGGNVEDYARLMTGGLLGRNE